VLLIKNSFNGRTIGALESDWHRPGAPMRERNGG
jgi:hypothetical protein